MSSPNPFLTPTGGRGRMIRTPTNLLFEVPELPEQPSTSMGPVNPPMRSREPSVASTSSSARKKKIQLETIRQINDVRKKYFQEIKSHEKEIAVLNKQISHIEHYVTLMPERDVEKMTVAEKKEWFKLQAEIKKAQDDIIWYKNEIGRAHDTMQYEVDVINQDEQIDLQLILLETDEEQVLGSDDEEKVKQWDNQNQCDDARNRPIPISSTQQFNSDEMKPFVPVATNRVQVQQQQQERTKIPLLGSRGNQQFKPDPKPVVLPPSSVQQGTGGVDVIGQLVTALGQAFGGGIAQRPQIISKQVDQDLPIFSGKPEDWLVFKNEYERTNKKYEHDDSVKAVRLRKYLKGDARDAVIHLLANPYNVDRIMEVLEERFGKPKHVLNAMIEKMKKLPSPDINKPKTIIDFGTGVDSLVTNIISYKKTEYLNNVQLLKDLVDKLPATMSTEWYRSVIDKGDDDEDLVAFQKWIWKEVRVASERYTPEAKDEEDKRGGTVKKSVHAASTVEKGCVICGRRNHSIDKCFQFKRQSNDERWATVKAKKLCFCCLSDDHFTRNCPSQKICEKDGCKSQHHPLLHYPKRSSWQNQNSANQEPEKEERGNDVPPNENNIGTITTAVKVSSATLPMIPVVVKGEKSTRLIFALLDSGASVSMIEKEAADIIGLDGPSHPFKFTVFDNEVKEEKNSKLVKLSVRGNYEAARSYVMENVHTVNKLGIPGIKADIDKLKTSYPHLRRMKAKGILHGVPKMIIGYDYFELFSPRMYLECEDKKAPSAYRGRLGWYVREKQDGPEAMEFRNSIFMAAAELPHLGDVPRISSSTDEGCGLGTGEKVKLPDVANFSNWMRLVRATASRYLACRVFMNREPKAITTEDLEKAVKLWIVKAQEDSYEAEMRSLSTGELIPKNSKLFRLSPALVDGVIVMDSRIKNANVAAAVKLPPFLDSNHVYTRLMIQWFHEKSGHFGQERVINELRQHVWILDCRNAVKRAWSNCKVCKLRRIQSSPPEMGLLPLARLDAGNSPFFHTGVDYFGPFLVKQGRSLIKRWGVLFSCLTTRAVHLKLAESLDTSDMISALIRFINLRGKPSHIWSDNGTNFIGAEREVREALEMRNQEDINRSLSVRGINWSFIPPSSPHMGGSWERMVGCVQRILYAQLKEQHPREVVLRTLFSEVMGILNSRPINHASTDPDDLECLTPNHLLNLKCVVGPSMPGIYSTEDRYRKAWRYVQDLSNNFWKRWSVEYLPWLAQREKWWKKATPLAVGDIVIVLEDNAPRNLWKRGIIVDVHQERINRSEQLLSRSPMLFPWTKRKR